MQSSYVISICLNPKWLPSGHQKLQPSPLISDFMCCVAIMTSQRGCSLNIISVMHNIVSVSIRPFAIFKSLCSSLWWWVNRNGSPAGHLTRVCLYYFSAVWSKMAPPMGSITSSHSSAEWRFPEVKRGVEGASTAGGLFRQDSCCVWNRDACQLCKVPLSPGISFHKKKEKKGCHCTMQKVSIICTSPVFTTVSLVSWMFLKTSDDVLF